MKAVKSKGIDHKYSPLEAMVLFGTMLLFMTIVLIPFVLLISGSLSSSDSIIENGVKLYPQNLTLDAFRVVFLYPWDMLRSYWVSIVVTLGGLVLNLLLSCPVGYAISKKNFRYKKVVTLYFMFTVMFNGGYIPSYIFFRNYLNIYNTFWVLILPNACIVGHIILLKVFYQSLPDALYESARIDGASQLKVFISIATPLILPGIATVAFYTVLAYWNDPFDAMLYTDDFIPVALYLTRITQFIEFLKYAQESGFVGVDMSNIKIPENSMVFAVAIITTAPMLTIFAVFQKYFVRGLTAGAVKG